MNIEKILNDTELTIALDGRLDANTADELETEIVNSLEGITSLIIDLDKLEYVSSAGLRVFLLTYKKMVKQGEMKMINANDDVMSIFEMTEFTDILEINKKEEIK
ncbi:MAG: STAS domain-containing protein [Lachnospiraceae bacterium]|nr:STAS domain-containing protein [Lachnospiraceae bacterium]